MDQEDEDFLYQLLTDLKGMDGKNMDKFLEHCRENPIPGCQSDSMEKQAGDDAEN